MVDLFTPLRIGELTLKNRIAMAPMTRGRAGESRVPNDLMAEYYFQRSAAGILITEATVVSKQGIGWIGSPGIYTDVMAEGWKKVTEKLKPTGTPIFLQLWHCGRASHSDFHNGELPVSASEVKLNGDGIHTPKGKQPYEAPRALTEQEIQTETRVKNNEADVVAFGRPFISNPDLVERLRNDWPLEPCEDMTFWYTEGAQGYTDYSEFRSEKS